MVSGASARSTTVKAHLACRASALCFLLAVLFAALVTPVAAQNVEPAHGRPGEVFGVDRRVASTDPRIGRMSFGNEYCTAWLTSAGVALTAAHCDFGQGQAELQFRVPPSDAEGFSRDNPDAHFRFPLRRVATGNNGDRRDWQVLSVGLNNFGENVFDVMGGFFRLRTALPPVDGNVQVTGYGMDDQPLGPALSCRGDPPTSRCNAQSWTEQTDIGPVVAITAGHITYQLDTDHGVSGGPVYWPNGDIAVAIHHGVWEDICGPPNPPDPTNANCGTLFVDPPLLEALRNTYRGNANKVVFVDARGMPNDAASTGDVFAPYRRLSGAVRAVCPNNVCPAAETVLFMVAGNYEGLSYTIPAGNFKLIAPTGRVVIGPVIPPQGFPQ